MSNITTTRDLAMTFYNEFIENAEDKYDPNCKFSKLMGEIDDTLFELLDYNTANNLEGKILMRACEDVEQHYISCSRVITPFCNRGSRGIPLCKTCFYGVCYATCDCTKPVLAVGRTREQRA